MTDLPEEWRPGSFTKNYSWGPTSQGLRALHEAIRVGFDNQVADVPRETFRERIGPLGRPDYIPMNFFLFNRTLDGVNFILADELVFQAINFSHSQRFDRLALFAFNLSLVGRWTSAKSFQMRPALWAHHYVADRLGPKLGWDSSKATADDIERFVVSDKRYRAEGARKLSTNLAYLYSQGGLGTLATKKIERWWVDALFLTLDRALETRSINNQESDERNYYSYLLSSNFFGISGQRSIEKELAAKHLVTLYIACGGRRRFDDESVKERSTTLVEDIASFTANSTDPIGAVHRSNIRILKSLPRVCAMLATYAGFEWFDIDELENQDTSSLARHNIERALADLREKGISPSLSSEEIIRLLRGE